MATAATPAIELSRLSVRLDGTTVLADLDVAIVAGKITGLLGPSGAGKTTLMRVIVGLQRPAHGRATIFGQPAGRPALRRQIGYVTQSLSVYPDLTVSENLRYFGAMVGATPAQIATTLQAVDLEPYARQLVKTLSGGQRARVSLAAALLGQPRLLVLDEPTVGLDPVLRQRLWQQFHELAASGTTLLISSHVMEEAERCQELLLLREGRLLATGTPAALKRQTASPTIEAAFLRLVEAAG
jgi:ABC-2 type transport system ATP-binding protein